MFFPPKRTKAPPNSDEQFANMVLLIMVIPVLLYKNPCVSINAAPPFLVEVTFIKLQFSISNSSNSFIWIAPALNDAFRLVNWEL